MDRRKFESILTIFQAYAHGYLVRKELSRARRDLEEIVREIDGDLSHLEWRDGIIPLPHFSDTDGPLSRQMPRTSANTPAPERIAVDCLQTQPPAPAPLCEETAEHQLIPEKIEAEKDVSDSKEERVSLCGVCAASSPAGGSGPGRGESNRCDPTDNGEDVAMESTDATSVWSSLGLDMSYTQCHNDPQLHSLDQVPHTPEALCRHRNTLAMELLWLQQAIVSRKKYLSLKENLSAS